MWKQNYLFVSFFWKFSLLNKAGFLLTPKNYIQLPLVLVRCSDKACEAGRCSFDISDALLVLLQCNTAGCSTLISGISCSVSCQSVSKMPWDSTETDIWAGDVLASW